MTAHALRAFATLAAVLVLAWPAYAAAATPPHVTEDTQTAGSCAICHRAHTANVEQAYRSPLSIDPTGNALLIAPASEFGSPGFPAPARGEIGLCYTCHGAPGLGSQFDVETSFTLESTHSLMPLTSSYGPSPKVCGSCHDPHGADRVTPGGAPYPRLLRSWVDTSTAVFSKEEFCASCHVARAASRFDGLAVYRDTGHYGGMPDPASGTKIRCSNCHVAHGSSIAPLISSLVTTPGATTTSIVVANDRRLCLTCHPEPKHTWSGETTYAASAHALSTATVAVTGEWPAPAAKRRVGECQVCHAAMGRNDGSDGAIPKLLEKPGRQLCDTCHVAGGAAKTDFASLAYPVSESTAVELAVTWGPTDASAADARVSLYGRATSGVAPRALIGPKEYPAPGAEGASAVGDIDGDGLAELVVGSRTAGSVRVFDRDALLGVLGSSRATDAGVTADFVAIGRFVVPAIGELSGPRPQIAVIDVAAGKLWLYENMAGTALSLVGSGAGDGSYTLAGAANGVAAGDFTADGLADLAITTQGADQLSLYAQDGVTPAQLAAPTTVALAGVRGPSIGDADAALGTEVAVCDTAAGTVRVYSAAGTLLSTSAALAGGRIPWATAVGNALPDDAGSEIAVAARGASGDSCLAIIDPAGSTFVHEIGSTGGSDSGSVLIADVEGDGTAETVLGDAGRWSVALGMTGPAVRVYRPIAGGGDVSLAQTLFGGGSELAGAAPALAVGDFGPVLPSRHPVDVVKSHVSTETGSYARHVTCSDCHDSHEATGAVAVSAPAVTGRMLGAWGTAVTNTSPGVQALADAARAANQYEVCLKCHATTAGGRSDIASLVNAQNASVHAVEGSYAGADGIDGSYVNGWANASVLYCTNCHGNSAGSAEATGTHRSGAAPLLLSPTLGIEAGSASLLCFDCHNVETYSTGTGAGANKSWFYTAAPATSLHQRHSGAPSSGGMGFDCSACHVTHGSTTQPHLLRGDIGYAPGTLPVRGECTNACHGGAPAHTYTP